MLGDYEAAVERFQRRVCTLAAYLLRDRAEAEDVTQEVLLKMWHRWAELDSDRLQAWLLRVTRNACFDRLRKRTRRGRAEVPEIAEGFLERAPDSAPDPARKAQAADLGRRIVAELAALDEPYRSIVVLREIQGLKYQEIADTLEMPLNTVRVYLRRGRLRLRERLREEVSHGASA